MSARPSPHPGAGGVAVRFSARSRSLPLVFGLAVLALWEAVCRLGLIAPIFLPAPTAIVQRLVSDLAGTRIIGFTVTTLGEALAGLRNGFTLSITGAVVGEFTMGGEGLGLILTVQRDSVDTTGMFATLVLLCAAAILLYSLIGTLENKVEQTR